MMNKDAKIYVAGHRGLVGSAIFGALQQQGYTNLVYRTSKELDLRDKYQTDQFFAEKNRSMSFLQRLRLAGLLQTVNPQLTS